MKRTILAVFLIFTLVASPMAGAAAAAPGINTSDDRAPNPTVVEDELQVAEHDRSAMDQPLEYYDDSGAVTELNATVNQSQDTPVGVRFDKIDAEAYGLFPRIDGESENSANWTVASDWTTSASGSDTMSVTDADADGVDKLAIDGTVASGNTTTAALSKNVSITSDANKRVLLFGGNVDTLATGATVEVRAVDADGDYRYAEVNASRNASADDVIANGTGTGFVFQEKLSNLPLAGTGDGSFDEIQSVEVVGADGDMGVTVAALDLDKKSETDLAEIQRDTDGDGELEATTITDYYEGGTANLTGLDTLGTMYDSAVINDLSVYDVEYQFADLADEDDYSTNFSAAEDYGSYPQQLELYGDLEVESAIDLSHGTLTLEFDQGLVEERYKVAEVASNADSTEAFGNLSDSSYSDKTGTLGAKGSTAEWVTSASADTTYRVHMLIVLTDDEVDDLQQSALAGGPTGGSDGGFFSTIWGKLTAVVGSVAGVVGLSRVFGGGS